LPVTETERIVALETILKHFGSSIETLTIKLDAVAVSQHECALLLKTILDRLHSGDEILKEHDKRIDKVEDRLAAVEHRQKDFAGDDKWPSWADIQRAHLNRGALVTGGKILWACVSAIIGAIAAVVGLPFWHNKP